MKRLRVVSRGGLEERSDGSSSAFSGLWRLPRPEGAPNKIALSACWSFLALTVLHSHTVFP